MKLVKNPVKRFINFLVGYYFQRKCIHPPHEVVFPYEGDRSHDKYELKWCRRCGAYHLGHKEWTTPRADWTKVEPMVTKNTVRFTM